MLSDLFFNLFPVTTFRYQFSSRFPTIFAFVTRVEVVRLILNRVVVLQFIFYKKSILRKGAKYS